LLRYIIFLTVTFYKEDTYSISRSITLTSGLRIETGFRPRLYYTKAISLGVSAGGVEQSTLLPATEVLASILPTASLTASKSDIQLKLKGEVLNRAHKDQFIHYEEAAEGIVFDSFEELLDYQREPDNDTSGPLVGHLANDDKLMETSYLPTKIVGGERFQGRVKQMLGKYKRTFNTKLCSTPADLPPMRLEVDKTAWEHPRNAGPPRQQTGPKQVEIKRQVDAMLPVKVIQTSQAANYSHVHLTPKPQGRWRFAVDYRGLNACSLSMGWPIPNINHMLQRLGSKKPKFFAKIDLTHGYHQVPLHPDSWAYTAFITFMRIYQWLRVPMGLKGAPSYFQQVMATIVLAGILYYLCEIYIDDVVV
jgi:hypothetical protein